MSNSKTVNNILSINKKSFSDDVQEIIKLELSNLTTKINGNIDKIVQEQINNFYNSNIDYENQLFDHEGDLKSISSMVNFQNQPINKILNNKFKYFTIDFTLVTQAGDHFGNLKHDKIQYLISKNFIIITHNFYNGKSSQIKEHTVKYNILLLLKKLFCIPKEIRFYEYPTDLLSLFDYYQKNPIQFMDKCPEFELLCKKEYHQIEKDKQQTDIKQLTNENNKLTNENNKQQNDIKQLTDENNKQQINIKKLTDELLAAKLEILNQKDIFMKQEISLKKEIQNLYNK